MVVVGGDPGPDPLVAPPVEMKPKKKYAAGATDAVLLELLPLGCSIYAPMHLEFIRIRQNGQEITRNYGSMYQKGRTRNMALVLAVREAW